MGYLEKIVLSAELMQGMASRVGADLVGHLALGGEAASNELRRRVIRCANCDRQDACARLQAETLHLAAAPDYCRNADIMQRRGD